MRVYSLERNTFCLCGSGKKYKNCCLDILTNKTIDININNLIESKDFDLALRYVRSQITEYMVYVKRHTELLLSTNAHLGNQLLSIDIKALGSLIEKMLFIFQKGKIEDDVILMLNNLGKLFDNHRWHEKLLYYKVSWLYIYQNKLEEARELLSEVSCRDIDDVEFLQLILDIKSKNMSFSNRIRLIEEIIDLSNEPSIKIQYMGALGIEYLLIGDIAQSKEIFYKAVLFAEEKMDRFSGVYDYFQLGNLYIQTGKIFGNNMFIENALNFYNKILEEDKVTKIGASIVFSHIADAYANIGYPLKALEYYKKSVVTYDNHISNIFIAQIYTEVKEFSKALDTLKSIEYDELSDEEKVDFVFIYAQLVLITKNRIEVEYVFIKLKELDVSSYYFSDIKNKLILELLEFFNSPTHSNEEGRVNKVLRKINDYFQLQPNIAGLGINFNNIIRDILERNSHS